MDPVTVAHEILPVLVVALFALLQVRTWLAVNDVRAAMDRRIEDAREEFGTRLARLEARARLGLDEAP